MKLIFMVEVIDKLQDLSSSVTYKNGYSPKYQEIISVQLSKNEINEAGNS